MTMQHRGSAQAGLGEWLAQRLSAYYLAAFTCWIVLKLGMSPPADYLAWKLWFAPGATRMMFALAFLSLLVHAWVGMRSVFLDYLHALWLRIAAHFLLAGILAMLAFWAAQILLIEAVS